MNKKRFIHIPEHILLRTDLDIYEKNMLGFITRVGECTASNKLFQLWLSCTKLTVQNKIKSLTLKGEIEVNYVRGKRTIKYTPKGILDIPGGILDIPPSKVTIKKLNKEKVPATSPA